MPTPHFRAPLVAAILLAATSCSSFDASSANPKQAPHALIIGLDGVRSDALLAAKTPNLDGLIEAGLVTWDAFAGGAGIEGDPTTQVTGSGPGWSSILIGVWRDKHKVADNSFDGNDLPNYPHLFSRIRAVQPEAQLVSIAHWAPINEHLLRPFPGQASLLIDAESDSAVAIGGVAQLQEAALDVLFLHFDDVDHAGHGFGYSVDIPEYTAAIELVDKQVGEVLAALKIREAKTGEEWLVIATTDHGGLGTGHGGQSEDERCIWVIAKGPGIESGVLSPGPGHTIVAPTVLHHMGVQIPQSWGLADKQPFGATRP
jgi:predicted AlkP superfamily pyrophosphatase or phosphodiesterase